MNAARLEIWPVFKVFLSDIGDRAEENHNLKMESRPVI